MRASIWGRWLFALLLDVQPAASAVNPVRVDRAGQTDCQDASIGTLEAGECADSATDCAKWAEAGECTRNAGYMRDACRLSCELCAEEEGKAALHQVGYFGARSLHFFFTWAFAGIYFVIVLGVLALFLFPVFFLVPDAVAEPTRLAREALQRRTDAREQARRAAKAEARQAARRTAEARRAAKTEARRAERRCRQESTAREAAESDKAARELAAREQAAAEAARIAAEAAQRQAVNREAAAREAEAEATAEREAEEMAVRAEAEATAAASAAVGARAVAAATAEAKEEAEAAGAAAAAPALLPFDELDAATASFGAARVIGIGGNATVYKADPLPSLPASTRAVAVKRLALSGGVAAAEVAEELRREVDILCRLSHAHVLPLLGYCLDHRGPSLVYPLAAGGNLEDRLLLTAQAPFRDASNVL